MDAEFHVNLDAFHHAARRLGFTGAWDRPAPVRLDLAPPADEVAVRAVETRIGRPLPPSLRRFYRTVAAAVDIRWCMPGREIVDDRGLSRIAFKALPPPPFQRAQADYEPDPGRLEPAITRGEINFSLASTEAERASAQRWIAQFAEAAAGGDAEDRAHYGAFATVWARGFPLGGDGGGNVIAVDEADEAGRLLFLSHDASDTPGRFIEHDLTDFLLVQSRLGFPGFSELEFGTFGVWEGPGDREQACAAALGPDADWLAPTTFRLEAESEAALVWRAWLGLLPDAPEEQATTTVR